ncbi:MAG: ABC transporter permease [Oscillospiraceae bacterium]|jgi:ribose transport system permease protein|nr:ABC transporter permease [Oscillospiraceae bacterium]
MKKLKIKTGDLVPFAALIVIFAFFAITSNGKIFSGYNLMLLLDQSMVTILLGLGMLFVVSQGSIDLSVGVNLALSGVVGTYVANIVGGWAFIPVCLIVGLVVGVFNGVMVARFKVNSFMLTISMLIGVRGIVNYIQEGLMKATGYGSQYLPESMLFLGNSTTRLIIFIVVLAIMAYLFEFTKLGRYGKAIGENETAAKNVGVPIKTMKILAFAISGLLAGLGGVFSVAKLGSTNQTMGVFQEMQTAMAVFLGGVLVTGGASAKIYKVVLGSISITLIVNGLAVIGKAESHISQSVEGIILLIILFITILVNNGGVQRFLHRKKNQELQ